MKIERATQLLFLLLISQGGNAAYANLPRGASASPVQVSAQVNKITVSGTVVDVNGEPLVGVSVLEKGTGNGTITDMDGNFTLSAGEGAALEISSGVSEPDGFCQGNTGCSGHEGRYRTAG